MSERQQDITLEFLFGGFASNKDLLLKLADILDKLMRNLKNNID
jgi:hypothetical protein